MATLFEILLMSYHDPSTIGKMAKLEMNVTQANMDLEEDVMKTSETITKQFTMVINLNSKSKLS